MDLTRNQKIVLAVVGVALITGGTIMVVNSVRKSRAKKKVIDAKQAKEKFLADEEAASHGDIIIAKEVKVPESKVTEELKPYVFDVPGETAEELKVRMDNVITSADSLKHSKFPAKQD